MDIIINTTSSFSGNSVEALLSLLKVRGTYSFITVPPATEKFEVSPYFLIKSNLNVKASTLGSPEEIEYMLEFAAKNNIKPWVQTMDISEESLSTAWKRLQKGDVRYRFTLTGYDKFFKA